MTVYVDTSALVKLLVVEPGSETVRAVWGSESPLASCRLLVVETRAAVAAAARAGRLDGDAGRRLALEVLQYVTLVDVTSGLVDAAGHLAETRALPAYDAVHLATALASGAEAMMSADAALLAAAEHEGLALVDVHT